MIAFPPKETEVLATNFWFGSPLADSFTAGTAALEEVYSTIMPVSRIEVDCHVPHTVEHGVDHFADYVGAFRRVRDRLSRARPRRVINLGGGCAAAIAILPYLRSIHPGVRVVWIDAHFDLNIPPTSQSHYIHGMTVGILTDREWYARFFGGGRHFDPGQFLFYGQRSSDPYERGFFERHSLTEIPAGNRFGRAGLAAPDDLRGRPVYIHLDVDVLQPALFPNPKCDVPGGLELDELAAFVSTVCATTDVVGYSIAENTETASSALRDVVGIFQDLTEPG